MQSFVVMAQLSSDAVPTSVRSFGNALDWSALQVAPPWMGGNQSCTPGSPCGRRLLSAESAASLNSQQETLPDKFLGMCILGLGGMLFISCAHLLLLYIAMQLQLPIPGQPRYCIDPCRTGVEQVLRLSLI